MLKNVSLEMTVKQLMQRVNDGEPEGVYINNHCFTPSFLRRDQAEFSPSSLQGSKLFWCVRGVLLGQGCIVCNAFFNMGAIYSTLS